MGATRMDDPQPRIDALRNAGVSDAVLLARLIIEGWSEPVVRAALGIPKISNAAERIAETSEPHYTYLQAPQETQPAPRTMPSPRAATQRKNVFSATTGALFGLIVLMVGFGAYTFYKPPVVYSISLPSESTSTPAVTYGALPALADPDYYRQVKERLMNEKASFIDADLSSMRLTVYTNGEQAAQVPILAKGKVGSWWETPTGIYEIQTRERNHLSTMGGVYMPFSMQFQGNFFIHGWPYYEDGTPVATTYSGGCIRLSTEDAQTVYGLASIGMPVIVYNAADPGDVFQYQMKAPSISATEYLVADIHNGTVLMNRDAQVEAPIASITKLVTALVATEHINLEKTVIVPQSALVYTSVPRLKAGQEIRVYDLLFLLLMESSNEAAEAIASAVGRGQFVAHMNDKARAIGLAHTTFTDPSGAKDDRSTPEDLFALLKYINGNRRFVFDITTGNLKSSAYGEPQFRSINNFNIIKNISSPLLGGKIGQTNEAGETYAGIFSVKIGGEKRDIAVIVLGSRDAQSDVQKLLTFVANSYAPAK